MSRLTTIVWLGTITLTVSLTAATPPSVKFTDTKLTNGLRLIVAEDHVAPVFSIVVGDERSRVLEDGPPSPVAREVDTGPRVE
jgi:hypothetical protein